MKKKLHCSILILAFTFLFMSNIVNAQSISAGIYYSVFRCSTGAAMSCGWNLQGQLGLGSNTTQPTPTQIQGITNLKKISAGGTHTLFLLNDSSVWATGYNAYEQLGNAATQNSNVPVISSSITTVKAIDISAGQYHSLVLSKDGTVWACGQNSSGQLGRGNTNNDYATSQIPNLNDVIAVSAGYSHSLFLKSDGTVWSCGSNVWGELGIGGTNNANKTTPQQVSGLTNIIAIAAGKSNSCHSLFLKSDGTVWACGYNANGQLGDGTTTNRFSPVQVLNLTNVINIKAGTSHSLFLKSDGTVWGCGENQYGQLGTGAISSDVLSPILSNQFSSISEIAAGNGFSLFLKSNGTVEACGKNTNGNLGNGTTTNAITPVNVSAICTISTGIKQNSNEENVIVFPNPSNGIFNIEFRDNYYNKNHKVAIVNVLGEVVFTSQLTQDSTTLDLNSFTNKGIYFVHIINHENKTLSIKKIVLK